MNQPVAANTAVTAPATKKKVALGMSGGVDSSVSARLLKDAGYDVTGVFLECWRAPGCRSEEDRKDALKVALELELPFQVLDFKQAYKDKVVEYFFDEYQAGRTPNPDVMCNKEIKFGLFYDWAMANGFDYVATGHYAQIKQLGQDGKLALVSGADEHKDQTYFLYLLNPEQLQHILFPIGDLQKSEVRQLAEKFGLHVATKKDSVGICFIGDIDVRGFLRDRLGENPGEVVDTAGHVIGRHRGLWFYTIGQRHGFTVDAKTVIQQDDGSVIHKENIPPFYVIGKKPLANQLVVGFGSETYASSFTTANTHWITSENLESNILVRIRHTGELWPAQLTRVNEQQVQVEFKSPVQGLAEGQSAVFYIESPGGNICLGGGVITAPTLRH